MARKLPKIITRQEYMKLMKAEKDKRVRLAMLLGFESGMRISEIVGLPGKIKPLTADKVEPSSIRIESGKGEKDRIVPRPKTFNDGAKKMLPLKIARRTLQRKVTILGKNVLNKHITFHMLRHGFVTECINRGMPLHEVQMFAGHSRLDTTGLYLHADPRKAIERYEEVF